MQTKHSSLVCSEFHVRACSVLVTHMGRTGPGGGGGLGKVGEVTKLALLVCD